ncbi:MAG: methyltransferase domain-containing protein [Simkaniaceae bacterium]|nr:methyltransferase domain-containing protein [Simkaniaceae bacterium]
MKDKIIEEYTPDYCHELEGMYGQGMMSEGGGPAIEHLLEKVDLNGLTALDIGCGLGGVCHYLNSKYDMKLYGIDINPWMIQEAKKRTPQVNFILSEDDGAIDLPSNHFDLIFSKGVLCHVEDKELLFREVARLLKPGGQFIVNDWIATAHGKWGPNVDRLMEIESLTVVAHSEDHYRKVLVKCGFTIPTVRDDTKLYRDWNQEIIDTLIANKGSREYIESYQALVKAFDEGECKVLQFNSEKLGV